MVSESGVTLATSVPILVFLGLSVLELGPMYATYVRQTYVRRQTDVRQRYRLMPSDLRGWRHLPYGGGGIKRSVITKNDVGKSG